MYVPCLTGLPVWFCYTCVSVRPSLGPDRTVMLYMCVHPSVSQTGPDRTVILYMCVILYVCVRPPIWAGPDWVSLFLNYFCNHVFVQLDQAFCVFRPPNLGWTGWLNSCVHRNTADIEGFQRLPQFA